MSSAPTFWWLPLFLQFAALLFKLNDHLPHGVVAYASLGGLLAVGN
jgi:hypothetical protein